MTTARAFDFLVAGTTAEEEGLYRPRREHVPHGVPHPRPEEGGADYVVLVVSAHDG